MAQSAYRAKKPAPYEFNSIPVFTSLPEHIQRRACEIKRQYQGFNPSSCTDPIIIAKASVKVACQELDFPLDCISDLQLKGIVAAFSAAFTSINQAVRQDAMKSKRLSVVNVLVKLGAWKFDSHFARTIAEKMLANLRSSGEFTGDLDDAQTILSEYQCAAIHLISKHQKPRISISKLATAMEMHPTKLDAIVARLAPIAKPLIERHFRLLLSPRRATDDSDSSLISSTSRRSGFPDSFITSHNQSEVSVDMSFGTVDDELGTLMEDHNGNFSMIPHLHPFDTHAFSQYKSWRDVFVADLDRNICAIENKLASMPPSP